MNTNLSDSVGVSTSRLERIQVVMQSLVDQGKLPGAVTMIARRGQVVHTGCFGFRDIEAKKPMLLDALFPIFSMTKPITAVAVMLLYEEGHCQLYDPVSKFIPEFKGGKVYVESNETGMVLAESKQEITVRDLLLHTAGLSSGFGNNQPLARLYEEAGLNLPGISIQDMARNLGILPRLNQPGEAWRYGGAYNVLAYLVEVLSGMPYDMFLKQRIFDPLGMMDTGFGFPKDSEERVVKFYGFSKSGSFVEAVEPAKWIPSSVPRGGIGLVSTASNYMRFAQMLLNQGKLEGTRLLSRKTVQLMTQNHLPADFLPIKYSPEFTYPGYGYGFGFRVLTDVVSADTVGSKGEFGWYGYAGTYFWDDPEEELAGLILMRLEPFSCGQVLGPHSYFEIINPFRVLAYQAIVD